MLGGQYKPLGVLGLGVVVAVVESLKLGERAWRGI